MAEFISISFWVWFIKGSSGKPGYRTVINRWLALHVIVGITLAYLVQVDLKEAANSVLLPLVGILIGLSFAWAGNVQALLQTSEIEEMTSRHPGGFDEYVYTFQTAIFIILVTLVAWALAGLEVYDKWCPASQQVVGYYILKTMLYALCSLTLRECWHVVLGAQWMLLIQRKIRRSRNNGQ